MLEQVAGHTYSYHCLNGRIKHEKRASRERKTSLGSPKYFATPHAKRAYCNCTTKIQTTIPDDHVLDKNCPTTKKAQ
jgi:hypothetical protein